jgi:hypothetical protein
MDSACQAFRSRYRAGIHPRYSAWLHGGFVLSYGVVCIVLLGSQLKHVQPLEWLTIPVALVLFNWLEYQVHKHLGHHKHRMGALFYKRHTGDHHSFFVTGLMTYDSARDWRVILFPAWLIVLFSLGLAAVWWLLARFDTNVASLGAATLLAGYLSYEILHACEHLPDAHPLARLPWVRHMRRLHELHHRRDLMQVRNFNIVLPLMDWVYGTLHWEPVGQQASASTTGTPPHSQEHQ